jgi:hypothetical protein
MMIVNAATSADKTVWQQTVTVTPQHDYLWEAYVRSSYSENPAQLLFTANGTTVMNPTVNITSDWTKVSGTWKATDGVDSVNLRIVDNLHAQSGDDFSIDDLSFKDVEDFPTAPAIVSPNVGQSFITQPILNDWTAATDNDGICQYRIEYIYEDGHLFLGGPYRTTDGTTTWRNHQPGLWEQGGVTIRVSAMDCDNNWGTWSNSVHYYYDATAPSVPVHKSPDDGVYVTTANQTLIDWYDSNDNVPEPITYQYQSAYDAGFGSIAYSSGWLTESQIPTPNTPAGTYYWHVRAKDAAGNTSAWSNPWVIHVDNTAPSTPSVLGFDNPTLACGVVTNTHNVTVQWSDSTDASGIAGYNYEIDYPLPGGGRGLWSPFFATPLPQYSGSLNEGTHYVKVRARDLAGNYSAWSNVCSITADWTAPDVTIETPEDGATLSGTVEIRGSVVDDNPHHYWFVVEGPSGTINLSPDVTGVINDTNSFTDKLLATWDTTDFPDGTYIIKLEARDSANNKDAGSIDWHTVYVENDEDNDGIKDNQDACPLSHKDDHDLWSTEDPSVLGVNRWMFDGNDWWTKDPKDKTVDIANNPFDHDAFTGCSCTDILDIMSAKTGFDFDGHYKFGCSKSILEDWSKGEYYIETVVVPANSGTDILTKYPLVEGTEYTLKASGTYRFANWGEYGIADAKYNYRSAAYNGGTAGWVNGATWGSPYQYFLQVKTTTGGIGWIEDYNAGHLYTATLVGDGNPISFQILDDAYGDNSGSISVDIYAQL